jgi:hypothetical protein
MKKKTFTWSSLTVLFFAACMVAACSGDEGEPGPAGTNGTDGTDGIDVGYEEAISKGNILLVLDGTRPDGIAFKDTIDFRFASTEGGASSIYRGDGDDDYNEVRLNRRQSIDVQLGEGQYGTIYSYTTSSLEGGEEEVSSQISVYYPTIAFPQEKKYFQLYFYFNFQRYFDSEAGELLESGDLLDGAVTSYKRSVGTDGKFSYKISGTVPQSNNNTGYDLNVTVIADAIVYEEIQNNNSERIGSSKANGRTAPATEKVAKAEMQSMK